jgi:hypothetical protein
MIPKDGGTMWLRRSIDVVLRASVRKRIKEKVVEMMESCSSKHAASAETRSSKAQYDGGQVRRC